jgi:hypothetical protein
VIIGPAVSRTAILARWAFQDVYKNKQNKSLLRQHQWFVGVLRAKAGKKSAKKFCFMLA